MSSDAILLAAARWLDRAGGRMRIYIEPRDAWVGVYVGSKGITYICPAPFLVIAWKRKGRADA
jgi:hypothetical protein